MNVCMLKFLISFRHSFKILPLLFALAYFLITPHILHSAQVTLAWDVRANQNVSGYRIYYGIASQTYQSFINVGNVTTYTVTNLRDGTTYYFATTDFDSSGRESVYSNEISYTTPSACTFGISPFSQSVGSAGIAGTVNVTAGSGCAWTAVSNASWITITSNSSGTGNGTVHYSVLANASSASRTGTLTVAGKTFTVTQSGACSYAISPTSKSFTSSAGHGSISVTAGAGCSWTATKNASWITITSGSQGTGNGTVHYSVLANASSASRMGTLTVAGKTFTVTQSGRPGIGGSF